jgi:hypothetical protein
MALTALKISCNPPLSFPFSTSAISFPALGVLSSFSRQSRGIFKSSSFPVKSLFFSSSVMELLSFLHPQV